MKTGKKIYLFLAVCVILATVSSSAVSALKIGDKLGDVLNTDIKVYINDYRIPSYAVNNKMCIVAEDLKVYGFDVKYDAVNRTLSVTRNCAKKFSPFKSVADNTDKSGSVAFPYVYTDIRVNIEGRWVESFALNGYVMIYADDLSDYGIFLWNSKTRELRLQLSGTVSSNKDAQNYSVSADTVRSYLVNNNDGTYSRIEHTRDKVIVEQYDADFKYLSISEIKMELPIFGGFYSAKDYNFIVFGQENPEEDNELEVYKVVKYGKDWVKLGEAGLSECNTVYPFRAGSLRMSEYGDMLYVRSSHLMYKSGEGLNHQSNITFSVSIPNMKITDSFSGVGNIGVGYVSHSFNQFIVTDGGILAALDHGDAYPRSIALSLYNSPAGEEEFTHGSNYVNLMSIAGNIGDNATGASIGGFEVSGSSYLTAGNSVVQDENYRINKTRNIFVSVVSTQNLSDTSLRWITRYSENGDAVTSTPHLVKIDDERFLVMWSEGDTVKYVGINGKGEKVSSILSMDGGLSDCKPIVSKNKVIWYVSDNSAPVFYQISVKSVFN